MAERRMFAKTIIDSDAFLDMPTTAQLLYFHLSMRADDDGFINNPKAIMRNCRCSEDDMKVLVTKKFIIPFESGIVVIKHWKIHNYIAKDRYKETKYKEEKATLMLDENNSYTTCIQPVHELDTQDRLGKDRLGKDRLGKDSIGEDNLIVSNDTICSNDLERIFEAWNSLSDLGITQIRGIVKGTKRCSQVRKRVHDYGIDAVLVAINKIRDSKFLQGKATDFTITFDWFIRPNNFIKVYEGNYDDKINRTGNKGADMLEKSYEMMKEWSETDG